MIDCVHETKLGTRNAINSRMHSSFSSRTIIRNDSTRYTKHGIKSSLVTLLEVTPLSDCESWMDIEPDVKQVLLQVMEA